MGEKTILLANEQETRKLGQTLADDLSPNTVILLRGNLGAGKTTFIQGLAVGLGIQGAIASPTFTLINEYLEGRLPLYHIDLYRLQPEEIKQLHLQTYWEGIEVEPGITAIEWSELLPHLPSHYLQIELSINDDDTRQAKIITDVTQKR
ncbi:tRNA (adenosine(37)-N6)-threonylcarbamoyltransferase complex ATPase subunit type 1 TsaE [Cyanobacterium stanieri LEGE 03274]|uniref:tRNA threonylcarbamoyladenosine biosynthesis protein TsaE n=1 Tax=Cyanobacterium stanieri LEGE 03274 TaxID=1828756 RepID=A0ABR9V4L6_9CHRO|nr:tRNA (adenosine(37)-N6)-threonylcarbamoyltransferase complex ATPase subunit type 1 TsaE [Cyanobacterium stanieri]MBE9222828.1 tRNA (adenosine(37)-N6)-threonylcarbamoyltransferase complex ATPase subunit type 1 TsaE [Cyanobacterium stanieri LEGE 03274]